MIPNFYKGNYLLLSMIPLTLIIISLIAILYYPGLSLGVDFKGGTLITLSLEKHIDPTYLENVLNKEGLPASVKVYNTTFGEKAEIEIEQNPSLKEADDLKYNFTILLDNIGKEIAENKTDQLEKDKKQLYSLADEMFELANMSNKSSQYSTLSDLKSAVFVAYNKVYSDYSNAISTKLKEYVSFSEISIQTVSPSLSSHFFETAFNVAIFSAILSMALVFIFFRTLVPSIAVIIGALSDIIIALGAMAIFKIPLSMASFAALLMLAGFSLDTDILLTTRLLKRKGDPRDKAYEVFKTGTTMTLSGILSFTTLYIVSLYTHISIYNHIAFVALAGLFGDLFATWGINAVILLKHLEGKI